MPYTEAERGWKVAGDEKLDVYADQSDIHVRHCSRVGLDWEITLLAALISRASIDSPIRYSVPLHIHIDS